MRKMTKTAVTLAAMSAMTVASATLAFAAVKEEANISAIDNTETPVDSSASGTWGGDAVKGYTFTKSDGTKLKDQWAEIDGIWYYFDGDKILRNKFKVLDDKGYFFDENGRLATGWQKISSKMDAYGDIDIAEELYNPYLNAYTPVDANHEYDYHDYVYCYFDEHGVAKENEWFQDWTGLWYYFDGNAMVKNVYDYRIVPDNYDAADSQYEKRYGFDEEGRMLIGWNYKKTDTTNNDPTIDKEGKVWYYYKSSGEMQKAGWATIDGKWYLFADLNADRKDIGNTTNGVGTRVDDRWYAGGYPLIVNSYVASYATSTAKTPEYFYVNAKGELASGVTEFKKAYKVVFYPYKSNGKIEDISVAYEMLTTPDTTIAVNFSTYAAKEDIVNDRYYTMDNASVYEFKPGDATINNYLINATSVFKNFAPDTTLWKFTDPGYVRATDGTKPVTGTTLAYNEMTRTTAVSRSSGLVEVTTGTRVIYVPKTDENETLINNIQKTWETDKIEGTKEAYVNAVSEYMGMVNSYAALKTSGTCPITGNVYTEFNGELSKAQIDVFVVSGEDAVKAQEREVAAYEEAIKKLDPKVPSHAQAITNYTAQKTAALSAKLDAEKYRDAAKAVRSFFDKYMEKELEEKEKEYQDAKDAEEEAWRLLNDAQDALKRNYYVDDPKNTADKATNDFAVVGELVKNAFIGRKDDLYLADKNGDFVKNKAVLISTTANLSPNGEAVNGVSKFDNAYIVFDGTGKALRGYESTKKSVTIGGVTYWSTKETLNCGAKGKATVFVANKQYNGKY